MSPTFWSCTCCSNSSLLSSQSNFSKGNFSTVQTSPKAQRKNVGQYKNQNLVSRKGRYLTSSLLPMLVYVRFEGFAVFCILDGFTTLRRIISWVIMFNNNEFLLGASFFHMKSLKIHPPSRIESGCGVTFTTTTCLRPCWLCLLSPPERDGQGKLNTSSQINLDVGEVRSKY